MLLIILRVCYFMVCVGSIIAYINSDFLDANIEIPDIIANNKFAAFVILLFISQIFTLLDLVIRRKRIEVISGLYFGILIGVLLAFLLNQALFTVVHEDFKELVNIMTLLIMCYTSVSVILQTKDDFRFVIPYVEFARDLKGGRPLVVDSSSLIDGRIADVVDTQILESQLVVPDFVLQEVQNVADSSDKSRRSRGRRGLEVLAKMQKNPHAEIRVEDTSEAELQAQAVDHRIVELAKQLRGGVITNDFNLNKVASVQGILVINLNDVANALRPRYIPGERLRIKIIKIGESPHQGVGYLDDGTMVVCEGAANRIGEDIDCVVTSVLQSSAGRMIFTKPDDH
ncbi:MAG TPA: PIN/TRAM domain-containing protein [Planctomycetaceae bacterium]|nr:PIN/TRAM domain-containing protein [Planctomycetaceae bacterium]